MLAFPGHEPGMTANTRIRERIDPAPPRPIPDPIPYPPDPDPVPVPDPEPPDPDEPSSGVRLPTRP